MEVTIRAYAPRDAADLADVFFRSVRQVALSAYTAAQVKAWAAIEFTRLSYHADHIEPRRTATRTQPPGSPRRYFREAH